MSGKFHRLSIQRTSDGRVAVAVDILGPIVNPLDGLSVTDKMRLIIRPYSRSERAMMRAVKGMPTVVRKAVAADILAARREQMVTRREQRKERELVDAWMEKTLEQPGTKVRIVVPTAGGAAATPQILDVTPVDREPEMG